MQLCRRIARSARPNGNLGTRVQVQFGQNVLHMCGHGAFADDQISGNLTVGIAAPDERGNLSFARAEQIIRRHCSVRDGARSRRLRLGDGLGERELSASGQRLHGQTAEGTPRSFLPSISTAGGGGAGLLSERGGCAGQPQGARMLTLGGGQDREAVEHQRDAGRLAEFLIELQTARVIVVSGGIVALSRGDTTQLHQQQPKTAPVTVTLEQLQG